jgi:Late competence development protein ComFB.
MGMFVNAQEDIVANETTKLILALNPAIAAKVRPAEIIAYTLNRVPPRYATTQEGMVWQRQSAIADLAVSRTTISHALQNVLISDPLHDTQPIHEEFFQNLPGILNSLCEVCKRDYMNWQDVAIAVQSSVSKLIDQHNRPPELYGSDDMPSGWHPMIRRQMIGLKPYISKARRNKEQDQPLAPAPSTHLSPPEELAVYLLRPRLRLINVMEELVLLAIGKISNPEVQEGNTPTEIAAYALNRLPTLYASSMVGYTALRKKGVNELSKEIVLAVRDAARQVLQYPRYQISRPFATDFDQQAYETLNTLRTILDREDVDFDNLVEVIREFMYEH